MGIVVFCLNHYSNGALLLCPSPPLKLSDIPLCLTGFYAFAGQWGGPFISSSWFIGLIISLYFVFPPISRFMAKAPFRTIAAIFFISLIARLLIGRDCAYPYELIRWFPLCKLFEFSLGIFVAAIVSPSSWSTFNNQPRLLQKTLSFCGEISFPLFLMHVPFLFMISVLCARGYNPVLAIGVFLLVSVGLSWMVLLIDRRIPKQKIFERLSRAVRPGAVQKKGPLQPQPPATGAA